MDTNTSTQDLQKMTSQYQNLMYEYQKIEQAYQTQTTHNWLLIGGSIFSFFVLLYVFSSLIG
ncbi:hypothetical protein [Bacillus toyonensis]|uniref:hypothetical protein n=1 Tax=Bacillus toyonensis TaxID=155322 RepID=UPI000BFC552F|nr:hypothetical protein [Bacillus toyonensis]PHG59741.1 hypothetical protein COI59_26325 [Bacillus toyonensis]